MLLNLGRCDDQAVVETVRELVREYRPLERASVVIGEVEEASGRVQGKGYFPEATRVEVGVSFSCC